MDEDNNDDTNPIIHPCSCKGSSHNVHFMCLKKWLESLAGQINEEKWQRRKK